jgi:hypothetical protein
LQETAMTGMDGGTYPYGEIPADMPARMRPPGRRKSLRRRFCEGIEAAVKAEPKAFAATKPRTMMGLMVRELVCAAASARCDAIKLVIAYLDEGEFRRTQAEIAAADNSQGNFEPEPPPEPRWDWDENGAWDSSERAPECSTEEARAARARTEALRAELMDKFLRAADADRVNAERKARLEAERDATNTVPVADAAPISGNIPAVRDPNHAHWRKAG